MRKEDSCRRRKRETEEAKKRNSLSHLAPPPARSTCVGVPVRHDVRRGSSCSSSSCRQGDWRPGGVKARARKSEAHDIVAGRVHRLREWLILAQRSSSSSSNVAVLSLLLSRSQRCAAASASSRERREAGAGHEEQRERERNE